MPKYQYCCNDCSNIKLKKSEKKDLDDFWYNNESKELLFIIECSMKDRQSNPKCPRCGSTNTCISYTDLGQQSWIRGNGIVTDTRGARRDMNRHHLVNQDPYGHMRQPGERDVLLDKMRRAGQDMGKIRKEHLKVMEKAKKKRKNFDIIENAKKILKVDDLNFDDVHIKTMSIIKSLDEAEMVDFSEIEDVNGVLSRLMPEYVCINKMRRFRLMANGYKLLEELTVE